MNKEKIFTNKINIIIIAIICTFLWGSAFPAVKVGYELFNILSNDVGGKLIFAGYRFFLAGVLYYNYYWNKIFLNYLEKI